MYSDYQLCSSLKRGQKCFRLGKYELGEFVDILHEHVPAHRISHDSAIGMMQSLILRYQEAEAGQILRHYLNRRGRDPESLDWRSHVEYPEPGVLRTYRGANVQAWMDEVIDPRKFRKSTS
jgi:hypothetical protein